jgi:hypothetical protein
MDAPNHALPALPARRRRLAGALLLAAVIAAGIGLAAGWLVYAGAEPDPEDQWGELGRALVALLAAVVVGVAALVTGTVVAVRRTVEPGRRLATGATALGVAGGGMTALGWLGESASRAGVEVLALPAAGLLVAAGAALVGRAAGLVSGPVALRLVNGTALVFGVIALLADVQSA